MAITVPLKARPEAGELVARARSRRWLRAHALPLGAAVVVVAAGMAYSLLWDPIVLHADWWRTPGDFWGTMRAAQLIGWGGEGTIYTHGSLTNAFPGIALLLTPVAKIAGLLHLVQAYPFRLAHPSGWLLEGPVEMALGTFVLFPVDTLAQRLGAGGAVRAAVPATCAVLAWPGIVMWGHPEDMLALGCAVYALVAAVDGRWVGCACWFAAALAFQPLVIVAIPPALGCFPWRRWPRILTTCALPSLGLMAAPLAYSWKATTFAVITQPTFPTVDRPTPWLSLARIIKVDPEIAVTVPHSALTVAAGPIRGCVVLVFAVVALVIGRQRPRLDVLVWLAAVGMSCRCLFDPVLCPYYAIPPLVLLTALAARAGWRRFGAALLASGLCTWAMYRHVGPWGYYVAVAATLVAAIAIGYPNGGESAPPAVVPAGGQPQAAAAQPLGCPPAH